MKSPDPVLTRMQRQDELTDIINTTGTTFLGLTLGCAKCHNHKFDPIPQHDFYTVQAVFAGVQHGERPLGAIDEPRRVAHRRELVAEIERTTRALAQLGLRPAVDPRRNAEIFEPVRTRRVRFTIRATNDGAEPCLDELVVLAEVRGNSGVRTLENVALASAGATVSVSSVFPGSSFHKREHLNDGRFGNERSWISNERGQGWAIVEFPRDCVISRIEWGRDRAGVYRDRLATDYLIEAQATDGRWTTIAGSAGRLPPNASEPSPAAFPARLSSGERHQASKLFAALQRLTSERENTSASPRVYSGVFEQPDPVHRLYRGDPGSPREVVNPSAIAAVGPLEIPAAAPEQERRVALARWIARPQNPLTARVMVNRLWHYHFGRGIVETPSDFGHNGGRPSHPELLDWLANELVRSGWSLKHVHRLILTSSHLSAIIGAAGGWPEGRRRRATLVALSAAAARGRSDPRFDARGQRRARRADGRPRIQPLPAQHQLRSRLPAQRRIRTGRVAADGLYVEGADGTGFGLRRVRLPRRRPDRPPPHAIDDRRAGAGPLQ